VRPGAFAEGVDAAPRFRDPSLKPLRGFSSSRTRTICASTEGSAFSVYSLTAERSSGPWAASRVMPQCWPSDGADAFHSSYECESSVM
jgi:hypothetical protein